MQLPRIHPFTLSLFAIAILTFPSLKTQAADEALSRESPELTATEPLRNLTDSRPRLIASEAEWERQVTLAANDPELGRLASHIVQEADRIIGLSPVTRKVTGCRMLGVSREALRRVLHLVTAYRISGDASYAQRTEPELLAVSAFRDWNPSHFNASNPGFQMLVGLAKAPDSGNLSIRVLMTPGSVSSELPPSHPSTLSDWK